MAVRSRRTGMIFIVVALVLIVILGAGAFIFKDVLFPPVGSQPGGAGAVPQPTPVEMDNVVVLTQNISFGQTIPDSAIALAPIPKGGYEGLYFKSKESLQGKRARYQLQAGTILTVGMLSESAVGSWASSQIPPGYVAISIPITKYTSVSYALQAGDHVSVMVALMLEELDPNFQSKLPNYSGIVAPPGETQTTVTGDKSTIASVTSLTLGIIAGGAGATIGRTELEPVLNKPIYVQPSESQRPRIVTQVLVSDAMVLYVGKFPKDGGAGGAKAAAPTPTPAPGVTPTPGPAPAATDNPEEITLVVTPQDAVTLNYIMLTNGAKLNLALRGMGEDPNKDAKIEAVTLQFLMDQYNIPFPSKLPYGLEPRDNSLNYFHPTAAPAAAPAPAQ
jgi:pilus assembly protein CpaB